MLSHPCQYYPFHIITSASSLKPNNCQFYPRHLGNRSFDGMHGGRKKNHSSRERSHPLPTVRMYVEFKSDVQVITADKVQLPQLISPVNSRCIDTRRRESVFTGEWHTVVETILQGNQTICGSYPLSGCVVLYNASPASHYRWNCCVWLLAWHPIFISVKPRRLRPHSKTLNLLSAKWSVTDKQTEGYAVEH